MNRGVRFRIQQTLSKPLYQILNCIDVQRFHWYNVLEQNEVFDNSRNNIYLYDCDYSGESFLDNIRKEHFVLFVKLQGYVDYNELLNINSYEEFRNSNCQLLLLIYDCEYVEIYSKNPIITDVLYKNAILNNFGEIEYITDMNDCRTSMNIL